MVFLPVQMIMLSVHLLLFHSLHILRSIMRYYEMSRIMQVPTNSEKSNQYVNICSIAFAFVLGLWICHSVTYFAHFMKTINVNNS